VDTPSESTCKSTTAEKHEGREGEKELRSGDVVEHRQSGEGWSVGVVEISFPTSLSSAGGRKAWGYLCERREGGMPRCG
jgi:hypothetical protein